MRNIAILNYSGGSFFELACAIELFMLPRPEIPNWYHAELVSFEEGAQFSNVGLSIGGSRRVHSFAGYDTVVIPSWPPGEKTIPDEMARALIEAHQMGTRLLSFCSGSFMLARLGLLDGRSSTTHWRYADQFCAEFPRVQYVGEVLYVYDGVIGTSAGSAAALDLGLAVIRDDYDSATANKVARRMVAAAHRGGGQAQVVEAPVTQRPNLLSETLDWTVKHLDQISGVEQMAQRACMSRRSFDRKFRAGMNMSSQDWLIDRRLDLARALLEKSNDSVSTIAMNSGFDSAETLRYHFRKRLGLSPTQYRERFSLRVLGKS